MLQYMKLSDLNLVSSHLSYRLISAFLIISQIESNPKNSHFEGEGLFFICYLRILASLD